MANKLLMIETPNRDTFLDLLEELTYMRQMDRSSRMDQLDKHGMVMTYSNPIESLVDRFSAEAWAAIRGIDPAYALTRWLREAFA